MAAPAQEILLHPHPHVGEPSHLPRTPQTSQDGQPTESDGEDSDDEEADFEPVYLTTEVSPEELFRLVKEAQRVEERALAAIAKRKACQVAGPQAEVGLVPTAAAGSAAAAALLSAAGTAAAAAGSRASGASQATTLAPL